MHASLIKEADEVLERMKVAMDVEMALAAAMRMRDVCALDAAIAKAEVRGDHEGAAQPKCISCSCRFPHACLCVSVRLGPVLRWPPVLSLRQ